MPSEERDAEMGDGIKVWRTPFVNADVEFSIWTAHEPEEGAELRIAYPADVARARERVVEAARGVKAAAAGEDEWHRIRLLSARLSDLDAAEGGAGT